MYVADFDVTYQEKALCNDGSGSKRVGKTTTIGKLAYQFKKAGKSVYLGAAEYIPCSCRRAVDDLG